MDDIYRTPSRRVSATLVRRLGEFDLGEEVLPDAFAAAVEQWPQSAVPANPRAGFGVDGPVPGNDALRQRVRHDASLARMARQEPERRFLRRWLMALTE